MKTNKIIKLFLGLFLFVGVVMSCVQDDEYDTPTISCIEPSIAVNATIADVKALYSGSVIQIKTDMIIEGYVVSNDEAGNFYRTLHFQDALENPTQGLQLDVDLQDMYTTYQVGRKIYINLNGLYLDNYAGVLKVGGLYELSNGSLAVGRLDAEKAKTALFRACAEPATVTPKVVTMAGLTDSMINTLIKLENVEIAPASLCQNYALEGANTNVYVTDCDGKQIIMRNSGFSSFWDSVLPNGNGTLVGVLSKYNSDYQLTIRSTEDVVMNDARCDGTTFTCEGPEANATIKDVKDIFSGDLIQIADDLVFDATVTANDESGNAYKYIYVQDETGGIQVKINQKDLYLRGYTVGQKITVSTKDLYLGQYGGEIQLGSIYNKNIGSIEAEITYKHLYIGEENAPLDATVMTIDNLTPENVGMLVQFNQVQFSQEDVPFADTSSNYPTNRDLLDCNANGLVVRTSKYANFAETTLPAGNGSIYGILNVYNGTYQLLVRDANDFAEMTNTKCDVFASAVQTNLSDIRAKFTGSKINIDENIKITAVITSDKTTGNINGANAFAQDATAGIALRFSGDHSLALGDKVEIALKGVALEEYNGLLQLNYIPLGNIRSTTTGALPTPKAITLAEALTGNYESQLVSIENVEFKVNTGDYSGSNTITDCTDELTMYVSSGATFKDDVVSALKGTIIGVMTEFNGTAQLYLRNTTDINFTDAYVDCSGGNTGGGTGSGADLYISEYAEGSSNNKYLEIYNGTGAAVSLADYSIEVYNNGSLTVTNSLSFTNGETIAAGDVFVVYNSSAVATIVDAGDISSTITYFNGDDAVVLLKSGVVIDAVGIIGVDPGSAWDVAGVAGATANHTLVRKSSVTSGNADWTASAGTNVDDSEWEVKANDDWTNLGIR